MKTKFFVYITLLFAVSSTTHAQTLRLATFNCEFLVHKKVHIKYGLNFNLTGSIKQQWDQVGFRDAKFADAVSAVAKEIKAINADVIVLTEVGKPSEVENLRLKVKDLGLDYPHHAVCKSTDSTTGQHVAVFSKIALSNVLKTISGREFYDKEADDPEEEGDTAISKGLYAEFQFASKTIHLYGLHLKSERGFSEADGQRIAQASIVRRHYLPLLKDGENIIVVGDLNDKRGDPALKRIRGRDDVFDDLIQTGTPAYFDKTKLGERWTYQFRGDRNQIDHILPSRSLKKAADISTSVHVPTETLPGGHAVTDHRGLVVEFEF